MTGVISNQNHNNLLTRNKEYEVLDESEDLLYIIADDGRNHRFYKYRFFICSYCKDRKCNSCKADKLLK